jgi:UDP-glucose 4-epimerase
VRILVTGGAGFIGSHVVDALLSSGHEVAILDNLATGNRENVNPKAFFYDIDVRNREGVGRVFAEFQPHVLNHHAAQAEVPKSIDDPVFDAEVNLLGGLNLLRSAADSGVRKFIFISTGGALYGDPEVVPCDETHPIRPLSPYGTSKYAFEQYLATFKRTFGLDYSVLRYANVYGPRQDFASEEGRVVAIFASRMLADEPVTIDWDGEQARDMLYVSDAVSANLVALERGSGEAYNIGTGKQVTINEIFRVLRELTGYRREPRHGPARKGDVYRIALDSSKAARELGWHASVGLLDGLEETVDWFRQKPIAASATGAG